jgi:hypothetical protein
MKVKIRSLLNSKSERVNNYLDINNLDDINKLCRWVVVDREAVIIRADGEETLIVSHGTIRNEVYNQKELLIDWCNLRVDEFPESGEYRRSSI